MPRISIVTPSFNQAQYLRRTIESVLSQNVDLEYIIVDGGSTDGSIDILKSYNSKIHLIVEKDNGQADAISKGFSLAKGDILAWLNSDDMYLPGALKKVVSIFNEGHEFIYGHVLIVDSNDRILRKRVAIPIKFEDLYYGNYILPQESTFFSRRLYLECGGIDTSFEYAIDFDLWLRMSLIKTPIKIDHFFSCFRFHDQQKSRQHKLYFNEIKKAKQKLYKIYPPSIKKSLILNVELKIKKLFVNLYTSGLLKTFNDIINKKIGRLP